MEKLYTDKDYAKKASEANATGQKLYIYVHDAEIEQEIDTDAEQLDSLTKTVAELVLAPYGYYVCYEANYTDGTINENFDKEQLAKAKEIKNAENVTKAKAAIENGYVEYKNAQFETNAQTVGDLTATMLMLQASGQDSYEWLSRDDKTVELTLEDFVTLGGLIAAYKNTVWNVKYVGYKEAIKKAKTAAKVNEIVIDYTNFD